MKDLMSGPNSFTFNSGLEPKLNSVASRGHHSIWRVYLDYPGTTKNPSDGVPAYLVNGLKFFQYSNYGGGVSPDWTNETLISAIVSLIKELGRVYDGDKRIGFIQAGFLGHWGEWHDEECPFASTQVQNQVLLAFNSSFSKTKVLARYPDKLGTYLAPDLLLGFHDDSFGQDTLWPNSSWSFTNQLAKGQATESWKRFPIGGELRPELQLCIFAADPQTACQGKGVTPQDWGECVKETHSSWQWNSGAFSVQGYPSQDLPRALAASLSMGYQFYIDTVAVNFNTATNKYDLQVNIWNKGNAPFYYPLILKVKYGTAVNSFSTDLSGLLPLSTALALKLSFSKSLETQLQIFLDSPVLNTRPIVFANRGATSDGFISVTLKN